MSRGFQSSFLSPCSLARLFYNDRYTPVPTITNNLLIDIKKLLYMTHLPTQIQPSVTTPDCRDTVLLAGVGRSGTTWMGDLLNAMHTYRVMFEPLHPDEGIDLSQRLTNWQYLRPNADNPALTRELRQMLTGRDHNAWTDKFNTPVTAHAKHILVKEIRMNFSLRWIHAQVPEMPIIYIVRHPGAVISSQMRMKWGTFANLYQRMLTQTTLFDDHLSAFEKPMRDAQGEFEMRAMMWCAAIYVLTRQFQQGEIAWVFYEDVVRDPIRECARLFHYIHHPYDSTVAQAVAKVANVPSATTNIPAEGSQDWVKQTNKWRESFSEAELGRLGEILALFGLDTLYLTTGDLQPNPSFTGRWAGDVAPLKLDPAQPGLFSRLMPLRGLRRGTETKP